LLSQAEAMLGKDDLIVNKLQTAMAVHQHALEDISNFIKKGKIIEKFQPKYEVG
jgi:hypothetical protein